MGNGETLPRITKRERQRQSIEALRDAVIDWDVIVDDARVDVDNAVHRLRDAVRERDRAALHLANVVNLLGERAA